MTAAQLIQRLGLQPHPEGGWFREVYRSDELLPKEALPPRYGAPRSIATSIYFLLQRGEFSAFHRLRSDELWFHLAGAELEVVRLTPEGRRHVTVLGPVAGCWQCAVPRGDWFAARLAGENASRRCEGNSASAEAAETPEYALLACVVAPGFDFADFELGRRAELTALYPAHAELIADLTRT